MLVWFWCGFGFLGELGAEVWDEGEEELCFLLVAEFCEAGDEEGIYDFEFVLLWGGGILC